MLDVMFKKMKQDLIEAGLLKPDEEISQQDLMKRWQELQMKGMRESMPKMAEAFQGLAEGIKDAVESSPEMSRVIQEAEKKEIKQREGMKHALEQLLNVAKGANYCMFVVNRGWVNLRYKKSKDSLYMQVAGNQYISPIKLEDEHVKMLEDLGIEAEEYSNDIFSTTFDDEKRDLDVIVDIVTRVFNEVYRVTDGADAYVEIDLGHKSGEVEGALQSITPFFERRKVEKQFHWDWDTSQ
jgi:hypothetical protein